MKINTITDVIPFHFPSRITDGLCRLSDDSGSLPKTNQGRVLHRMCAEVYSNEFKYLFQSKVAR